MSLHVAPVDCRVCRNGEIVHMTCECCGSVVLCCEECMTCYRHPDLRDTFRGEEDGGNLRPSTAAEIRRTGWWPEDSALDGGPG